jgi:hypothetical protein
MLINLATGLPMSGRTNRTARYHECVNALCEAGIDRDDAIALRRIAMTLHSWHELECGTDRGAIERDEATGKPFWRGYVNHSQIRSWPVPDREKAALQRLQAVMSRYPTLSYYVQGDPRGAALYILRPGDVPAGGRVDAFYNCGIAVYK